MTISSQTRKAGPFVGNDSTTAFPFAFKVFSAADMYVVKTDTDLEVETVLVLNTDYTVSLNADQNANPGGTITLPTALATGFTLTVTSNISPLQQTDLTNQGGFYPSVITNALDKLTILVQQALDSITRSLKLPVSTPSGVSTTLPLPSSNKLIGWNQDADGLQNVDPTTLATIVAFGTANADVFDGDGVTTQFNLTANPGALNNLDVSIGGVTQTPGLDYTWTSGTVITFTSAPPLGTDNVLVRYMQGLPQGTTDAAASFWTDNGGDPRDVEGTLQRITGEYISVKDPRFGAVGDGVTDDTPAIQAAITWLGNRGGGRLFFPVGTYLSNRLTIRASNVALVGEGRSSWLKWTGTPGTGVFGGTQGFITAYPSDASYPGTPGTQLENIRIENLRITGQDEAVYTAGRQGIQFENVKGGYVGGCFIEKMGAETIIIDASLGGSRHIVVEHNEISRGYNYWNPGASPGCVFRDNYCHDQLGQGCEIRGTGNVVTGNHFKNSGTITLLNDYNASDRGGIIFTGNTLESCAKVELNTQTGAQVTNVIVANNLFWKGTGTYALLVRGGANTNCRNLITGNIITEQVSGGGIELIGGYGGVITNNVIFPGSSGNQHTGIAGDVNAKAHIYDNHVVGHATADISVNNRIGYVGPNFTGSMAVPVSKSSMHSSTLSGETGNATISTDTVLDLATNTTIDKSATAGMLMVNIRSSSATTGRNLLSSFVAHVSGGGHHTSISNTGGPSPGSTLNVVNTLLTGTSGGAGTISVSVVSGTSGAWKIQVENRAGADIYIGWQIMGITS